MQSTALAVWELEGEGWLNSTLYRLLAMHIMNGYLQVKSDLSQYHFPFTGYLVETSSIVYISTKYNDRDFIVYLRYIECIILTSICRAKP
jgi:hypothetical protein